MLKVLEVLNPKDVKTERIKKLYAQLKSEETTEQSQIPAHDRSFGMNSETIVDEANRKRVEAKETNKNVYEAFKQKIERY